MLFCTRIGPPVHEKDLCQPKKFSLLPQNQKQSTISCYNQFSNFTHRPKKSPRKYDPGPKGPIETLPELMVLCEDRYEVLMSMLEEEMQRQHIDQVCYG